MQVEYIEPFVLAAFEVIEKLTGDNPARGSLALRDRSFTTQQVTIVVGVTGPVQGQALYGMSVVTACKIAGSMTASDMQALSEMGVSAIAELGNMITAHATARLATAGIVCDITPPSVIRGMNVEVCMAVPGLVVPVMTEFGKVEVNVSLRQSVVRAARAA